MDSQASWEQGMGSGWSIVALKHRINPQGSGCHLQEISTMQLAGHEQRARRALDEVIALGGELTHNIWTLGSPVASNEAVSHH